MNWFLIFKFVNSFLFISYSYLEFMNFNIDNMINIYIKNDFHFIQLEKHKNIFKFNINYVEKNLLYIQIINLNKIAWNEDLILRLYDINNKEKYEDLSIGGCKNDIKEIELFTQIDLEKFECKNKKNIPNTIIQIKEAESFEIKKIYEFYYFLYKNNQYNYQNININDLINQIETKYPEIIKYTKIILNENNRLFIIILLYLNLNGGIFISEYIKNLKSLDDLNIDENALLIKDNYIFLLFTKINFLNIKLLEEDIKNKKKLDFKKYLMNFKELNLELFDINEQIYINKNEKYYTHYFEFEIYNIYLFSKKNQQYNIEKLSSGYFNLNSDKNIEHDLEFDLFLKKENKKIKWNNSMIKFKSDNNYIFKI